MPPGPVPLEFVLPPGASGVHDGLVSPPGVP
jgi:hypothetical protein